MDQLRDAIPKTYLKSIFEKSDCRKPYKGTKVVYLNEDNTK